MPAGNHFPNSNGKCATEKKAIVRLFSKIKPAF